MAADMERLEALVSDVADALELNDFATARTKLRAAQAVKIAIPTEGQQGPARARLEEMSSLIADLWRRIDDGEASVTGGGQYYRTCFGYRRVTG